MSRKEAGKATQSAFRRASFCASNECAEVGQRGEVIMVRDSAQHSDGAVLRYAPADWASFVQRIKQGGLDNL